MTSAGTLERPLAVLTVDQGSFVQLNMENRFLGEISWTPEGVKNAAEFYGGAPGTLFEVAGQKGKIRRDKPKPKKFFFLPSFR